MSAYQQPPSKSFFAALSSLAGGGSGPPQNHLYPPQQPASNNYDFRPSQYEYGPETRLRQDAAFVESGLVDRESELYNLQLIFLIDISGSMQEDDVDPEGTGKDGLLGRGRWTRYDNMVKILRNMIGELIKFDKDHQIPCYFFNNRVQRVVLSDPNLLIAQVRSHTPGGSTALHLAFHEALQELNDVENFLFIVFTDGVPDNHAMVSSLIQNEIYVRDPSGNRINILFLRFGDDPGAIKFLQDQDDHPVYGGNVDHKSDNAAYLLGPKLLVLNALYEAIEKDPRWADRLSQMI